MERINRLTWNILTQYSHSVAWDLGGREECRMCTQKKDICNAVLEKIWEGWAEAWAYFSGVGLQYWGAAVGSKNHIWLRELRSRSVLLLKGWVILAKACSVFRDQHSQIRRLEPIAGGWSMWQFIFTFIEFACCHADICQGKCWPDGFCNGL